MKNTIAIVLSTCTVCAIFPLHANAVLVDNGAYTSDTETGLDWLDLTETSGLSYNSVSSELGSGGLFEGWSYATIGQIEGLFGSAGGQGPYEGFSAENNGVVMPLLAFWGATDTQYSSTFITAKPAPIDPTLARVIGRVSDESCHPDYPAPCAQWDYMAVDYSVFLNVGASPTTGSALVRISAVPIPAAIWLFGSGLFGLLGIARRRKAA